jgi:hypothetical protein
MTESELDTGVRRVLASLKASGRPVLAYHTHDSRHSASGFPDWCFTAAGGVMWRELKRAGQQPRPDQAEWLNALTRAGMDAGTWYPADLLDGTIARELAALAGMGETR